MGNRQCIVANCPYTAYSSAGLCQFHRTGEPLPLCSYPECTVPRQPGKKRCMAHFGLCEYPGCGDTPSQPRPGNYNRYCNNHLNKVHRYGDPDHPGYTPLREWSVDKSTGYMRRSILGSSTKEFQHRIVMEETLGRKLLPGENVHHKDGDRTNNEPSNLELWTVSQPAGQRVQDKIQWAEEFLAQYGYVITYEGS